MNFQCLKSHASMLRAFFVYTYLGTLYADFQEKIFPETSGKKLQTFHCSNVTTMKSLELFPRHFREDFFLKISIKCQGIYKNYSQQRSMMWLHPSPIQSFVHQASHCSALLIGWLKLLQPCVLTILCIFHGKLLSQI